MSGGSGGRGFALKLLHHQRVTGFEPLPAGGGDRGLREGEGRGREGEGGREGGRGEGGGRREEGGGGEGGERVEGGGRRVEGRESGRRGEREEEGREGGGGRREEGGGRRVGGGGEREEEGREGREGRRRGVGSTRVGERNTQGRVNRRGSYNSSQLKWMATHNTCNAVQICMHYKTHCTEPYKRLHNAQGKAALAPGFVNTHNEANLAAKCN